MTIDLTEFHQVFFEEATEHLDAMENLLLKMNVAAPGAEELAAIFRAAHSIKGGAATFGFQDMAELTHDAEALLDKVRRSELALSRTMVDVMLETGDALKQMVAARRADAAAGGDAERIGRLRATLRHLASGAAGSAPAGGAATTNSDPGQATPAPGSGADDKGYGFFAEPPPAPEGAPAAVEPAPRTHGRRATDDPAVEGAVGGRRPGDKLAVSAQGEASSIRVSVEKVDKLINLVGELVITQAMLAQAASQLEPVANEKLLTGMAQLDRSTRDLQESVMSIRMLPISSVFSRFPRMVRDLAVKLGKSIELKTEGETTELDKGLIEKLADPLTHLVRNSIDHGIEIPEARAAAGKPEQGTLTLRAFHQGGNIMVEVSDDGAGLPRGRILAKARELGMAVSDSMSDQDVFGLIFDAGFSTAEEVTDVSGRGVGMDVVKRNIQGMGGRVEIQSLPGHGTRISIRLPLTLAILDGMSVAVGDQMYILPLTCIVESLRPARVDINTIGGRGQVVRVRGEYLPVIALHQAFNLRTRGRTVEDGILMIVESDGAKVALLVDELVGQHQVVIKSLETNYRKVRGVSGATIMGDGRVALILDMGELIAISHCGYAAAA